VCGCYIWIGLLKFCVEILLLLAADRLCGKRSAGGRVLGAALIPGVYTVFALVFPDLSHPLIRILGAALTVLAAFGFGLAALYRTSVYLLLNAAIGGFAQRYEKRELMVLLAAAVCICFVCFFVSEEGGQALPVPVELCYGQKKLRIQALRDTGNTLRDPLTGRPVLVIGADAAGKLTGLSVQQLRNPAETLCSGIIPGLRLIPYKTVGESGGLLLALKLKKVKIGSWTGSSLVAFAPETIGNGYEALTGGNI